MEGKSGTLQRESGGRLTFYFLRTCSKGPMPPSSLQWIWGACWLPRAAVHPTLEYTCCTWAWTQSASTGLRWAHQVVDGLLCSPFTRLYCNGKIRREAAWRRRTSQAEGLARQRGSRRACACFREKQQVTPLSRGQGLVESGGLSERLWPSRRTFRALKPELSYFIRLTIGSHRRFGSRVSDELGG